MQSIGDIIAKIQEKNSGKYMKYEWQLYGYRLAMWLEDEKRMSMYMKLAKTEDRVMLQKAWDFVKESNARSKPKLFMWKLAQLRKEKEERLNSTNKSKNKKGEHKSKNQPKTSDSNKNKPAKT